MKLIMNDGQQVPVQTVTETGGTLKIRLLNQTSAGLKAIFQDALAVQKMTAKETGQADRVYEGYTELVCISEYTGAIWEVEMRKTEADPDTRLAQVEEDVEKLKESGGKIPESARLAIQYATETMTDQQCLDVLDYVERWNPNGVTYKKDKRVAVEEDGSLALYKCLQEHTSQENWKPGMDTASPLDPDRPCPCRGPGGSHPLEGKHAAGGREILPRGEPDREVRGGSRTATVQCPG